MVVVVGVLVNLNFCTRGMKPVISPERGGRKHPESTRLGHGTGRGLTGPCSVSCWSAAAGIQSRSTECQLPPAQTGFKNRIGKKINFLVFTLDLKGVGREIAKVRWVAEV